MGNKGIYSPYNTYNMYSLIPYLEGQGDLGSRNIIGITGFTIWVVGVYEPTYQIPVTPQVLAPSKYALCAKPRVHADMPSAFTWKSAAKSFLLWAYLRLSV